MIVLSVCGLFCAFFLVVFHYGELPDTIATHFNLQGQADTWKSKQSLWSLPIIGTVVWGIVQLAAHHPHYLNYSTTVTEENAADLYRKGRFWLQVLSVLITLVFLFLTWRLIQVARTGASEIGFTPLIYLLAVYLLVPLLFILFSKRGGNAIA